MAMPDIFPTMSSAKKACRKTGRVQAHHQGQLGRCASMLQPGDEVRIVVRDAAQLRLVHVDSEVCVIHKPPGLVIHGHGAHTLCALLADQVAGAQPCHRLDAPTEGLVVCGRNTEACQTLHEQFRDREVSKRYIAVVHGSLAAEGTCTNEIEGKDAKTEWRVRWRGHSSAIGAITCLDLWPVTGRKHQLRRHMSENGTPIVGDVRYCGERRTLRQVPLLLAAVEVSFEHPVTEERVEVSIEEPARFRSFALLPEDADESTLLAAVIRAGQRHSDEWKACGKQHC